jgi:hypothetical protein
MTTKSEVHVTLSAELWSWFHQLVSRTGVPLEWLVAGLVCDTLENVPEHDRPPAIACGRYQGVDRIALRMARNPSLFCPSPSRRAASRPPQVGRGRMGLT